MMTEILILRIVHIVAGTLWVGTGVFNAVLLMPVLNGLGPSAGPVMAGLRKRGLYVFLPTVSLVTILAGLRLMWLTSGGFSAAYFATAHGATYAVAGAAAITTWLLGMTVSKPTMVRIGRLTAELTTADESRRVAVGSELAAAQRTSRRLSIVLTTLLLMSATGMAVARYLA